MIASKSCIQVICFLFVFSFDKIMFRVARENVSILV